MTSQSLTLHCYADFHDWMLLVIVAVVVAVDVLIFLIGTAIPQTRIVANLTADVEHPSFINVRWLPWLYVTMVTLLIHAEQRQCNNNNSTVVFLSLFQDPICARNCDSRNICCASQLSTT